MVDQNKSSLIIVDDWMTGLDAGAIDRSTPVQEHIHRPSESVRANVAQALLDNACQDLRSPGKHTLPSSIDHLATPEARLVYSTQFDDDIRELQEATAAFLADQYDDGEYVATPEDIADLQNATAAFLADRCDAGYFCSNNVTPGLLLPGEDFLFPAKEATDIARTKPDAKDVLAMIDEYLNAQMSYENETNPPALDDGFGTVDMLMCRCTSFDSCDKIGDEFDNADSSDTATVTTEIAFDAPDALSLSQASYAASFFDANTATLTVYTSMNELLNMDDEDGHIPCVCRTQTGIVDDGNDSNEDVAEIGSEVVGGEVVGDDSEVWVDLDEFLFDNSFFDKDELLEPLTTHFSGQGSLKIVTQLPVILEEDEPYTAVSNSSMDFANHRGVLQPLSSRRENFLEDADDFNDAPNLLCATNLLDSDETGRIEEFFADHVWIKEPSFELQTPVSLKTMGELIDQAKLELFQALAAVSETDYDRFSTDVPTFGAELERESRSSMKRARGRDFGLTERLEVFIDLTMKHMAALD